MPDLTPLEAAEKLEFLSRHFLVKDYINLPGYKAAVDFAASLLRAIAAGEYKQVVHAHWKLVSESAQCNLVKCTHCGCSIAVARNVPLDEWRAAKPYCDQCGGLMDGKDDSYAPR